MLLLDLCVSFYQATCLPNYQISRVRRDDYIVFDRQPLAFERAEFQSARETEWARSRQSWNARAAREGWGARRTMQKKLQLY